MGWPPRETSVRYKGEVQGSKYIGIMAVHGSRLHKGSEIKGNRDLRRVYTCIKKEGTEFQRRSEAVHVDQGKLKRSVLKVLKRSEVEVSCHREVPGESLVSLSESQGIGSRDK